MSAEIYPEKNREKLRPKRKLNRNHEIGIHLFSFLDTGKLASTWQQKYNKQSKNLIIVESNLLKAFSVGRGMFLT